MNHSRLCTYYGGSGSYYTRIHFLFVIFSLSESVNAIDVNTLAPSVSKPILYQVSTGPGSTGFKTQNLKPIELEMLIIPAGSFIMSHHGVGDKFTHHINVEAFKLSNYETSFDQWDAGGCWHRPNDDGWGRGHRPVINVSYKDINGQYIPWLNHITGQRFRLPSEAEWEYAARAGSRSNYYWGNESKSSSSYANGSEVYGWPSDGYHQKTAPVGSFLPNMLGLYDMSGNVSEWTKTCWESNYRDTLSKYSIGRFLNRVICNPRVIRGGSWGDVPSDLSSTYRSWSLVSVKSPQALG